MPYKDPEARREQQKRYRLENLERLREAARQRRLNNPKYRERERAYYREHADEVNARTRAARAANPERFRANEKAYRDKHKEKRRLAGRARYYANPEYFAEHGRKRRLKRFGLTPESYEALKEEQGRACAICRDPFPERPEPHIDHCHRTGRVRGLLCGKCNQAIGLLRDDPALIERASAYVRS